MHKLKRCLCLGLAVLLTVLAPGVHAAAPGPDAIIGAGAVLMDQATGQVLFEKNADMPLYPASTTKILTALIILEDTPLSEVVTIDAETPFVDGSRIYLMEGEQVTVEQLLYAMLLASANDAAIALAKHHSGTVQAFSRVMNSRARALGAVNSHFVNPNGLPDPEHVASARDLALIACEAMKHPEFRKIVSTVSTNLPPTNTQPEIRHLQNGNRLLYGTGWRNSIVLDNQTVDIKWDLADGIKTGYTTLARQCLVASASSEGRRVVAVTLKSEGKDVYRDVRLMLRHGLEDFKNLPLVEKGAPMGAVTLPDGKTEMPVLASETRWVTVPKDAFLQTPAPALTVNGSAALPVRQGQIMGTAAYTLADGTTVTVPLAAAEAREPAILQTGLKELLPMALTGLEMALKALAGLVVLYILWRSVATWRRLQKRKRLQRMKARAERNRSQNQSL